MTSGTPVPGLSARRAQRADLPRLLELLADDALGKNREGVGSDDPAYSRAFDTIDRDPNQQLLVAELDGRVVGMLQVTFFPGLSRRGAWRANIEAVRVDSSLRGRGIGTWLMNRAIEVARKRGCRLAQLTSDRRRTEAHRFYDRLGFRDSHVGYKLALEASE
ncbi:MAG TPA: GNAT family N-acetyltransferase [Burkholderiaceae bacterium]|nr:GNAT family N-acetyltransferase [Burkholderiaceae bacterium]HQR71260.1 GNAT family N-acetyltransferase [Burkholderiaceae bacterium]